MKILIVCASNICRSPYAEYLLKRKIAQDSYLSSKIEWVKSSAVMNKMRTIHPKAKCALAQKGFTLEEIALHKPSYLYLDYKNSKSDNDKNKNKNEKIKNDDINENNKIKKNKNENKK